MGGEFDGGAVGGGVEVAAECGEGVTGTCEGVEFTVCDGVGFGWSLRWLKSGGAAE